MPKKGQKLIRKEAVKKREKSSGLKISVWDKDGQEKEIFKLPKEIFQIEVKPQSIAQYIKVYLANQRQRTASTKTRREVSGSTRKIYRQKGTGRARHGDIKAPIFVGGGIAHGPRPKNFSLTFNKKQKRQVFFASLTLKNKEGKILVVDDNLLKIKAKTKEGEIWVNKLLIKENKKKPKLTMILPKMEKNNLFLALKNLPYVNFLTVESLNTFEVLKSDYLIFLKSALDKLINFFLKKTNEN